MLSSLIYIILSPSVPKWTIKQKSVELYATLAFGGPEKPVLTRYGKTAHA